MCDTRQLVPAAALAVLAITLASSPAGCQPRPEGAGGLIGQEQPGTVIAFVIDTSGSFSGRMDDAYRFFTAAVDTYFRSSIGEHNELIISQVSAAGRPALLWRGPPEDLRTKFPSAAAFRSFLASRSDPAGSRVHDGLIDTIDEVLSRPGSSRERSGRPWWSSPTWTTTRPARTRSGGRKTNSAPTAGRKGRSHSPGWTRPWPRRGGGG